MSQPPVQGRPAPGVTIPADKDKRTTQQKPWDETALHIKFVEGELEVGKTAYEESRVLHSRLSADKPKYPMCTQVGHFRGSVFFFADYLNTPRPAPFKPPAVMVKWKVAGKESTAKDENPTYLEPGRYLRTSTSFGTLFRVEVHNKDTLEMEFTLQDKDTNTTLTYKDKIQVETVPCA